MKNWYGCIGFVSLLGVWGALAGEPLFYPFFAFLVFFEYFWVTPDEMFLDTMKKCAATAFSATCSSPPPPPWPSPICGAAATLWQAARPLALASPSPCLPSPPALRRRRRGSGDEMIKNRIKEYRAIFDMKQEELARLVGVRRETIGNLEKGRYNPSLALAWRIAQVFKVPIEDVFTVED